MSGGVCAPVAAAPSSALSPGAQRARLAFVLLVGAAFAYGILARVDVLAGPWYWKWPWRDLGLARTLGLLLPPLVPFLIAWRFVDRDPPSPRAACVALVLLTLTNFMLQVLALMCHPRGIEFLRAIVISPVATSYFSDAQAITDVAAWLRNFHTAALGLHSATHPPGPILYYYAWLKLLGPYAGAIAGGLFVGVIAALGVPVVYAFAGLWSPERRPRLVAGAMYALLPALIVFLPEFDQVYPIFAMLIAWAWVVASRGSLRAAVLLGATLLVASFFAYNLLVVGAFVALHALYVLRRERGSAQAWARLVRVALVAIAVPVAGYLALWLATGFDALRSVAHAMHEQNALQATLDRPWWAGVLFAPFDFFLGAGMLVVPLLILHLVRVAREFDLRRDDLVLSTIALGKIAIVDVSGLLRAETARIWLFLQPFALVPAARELDRLGRGRVAVLLLQWFVAVVLLCRMIFINA